MQPLPVSEQIFANRRAMIQFQRKTDKINPSFYCAVLNSVLPWENISCFIFINIYVIPSGKHVFFRKLNILLPDINLTVCLHMGDYGHFRFLHSYLRHFCLLEFFALLLEITSYLELWSSFLALEFEHP